MGWKDKLKESLKRKSEGRTFKVKEGDNVIRILPARDALLAYKSSKDWKAACADNAPAFEFLACRDVGPEKKFVRSGKNPDGSGSCWLSDKLIPYLLRSRSKADRAAGQRMQPGEQFVVQVAYQDSDGEWRGPAFWYVPKGLQASIIQLLLSAKRQYDNPVRGYNLNLTRTGTGMRDTKYGPIEPDDEPSKIPVEILKRIKPWSDVIGEYSEDDQKAAFGPDNIPEDLDDSVDEDDVPKKAKGKKKAKPEPADEDEFDMDGDSDDSDESDEDSEDIEDDSDEVDDDSDEVDDDSDEDDESDDDADEDLEEEEPEPAPKKSKAKPKAAKKKSAKKSKAKPKPAADDDEDFDDDDLPF